MASELAGRRVLVTAGAAGIGRAIAEAFLEAGARVQVCDIDAAALEAFEAEGDLGKHRVDVTDEAAVDALFDQLARDLGGLDVLINNAGIAGPTGPAETLDYAAWQHCVAVNLFASFLCVRRAAPWMKAAGRGSIVNLSSTAGFFGYPLRTPYAAAKWAVNGLTKSLAMELGPFGVRVNALAPGPVAGARMDRVIAAEAKARGLPEAEVRRGYAEQVSLRGFVEARDVAEAALFLCSDAAARISGQVLAVDGHTERLV